MGLEPIPPNLKSGSLPLELLLLKSIYNVSEYLISKNIPRKNQRRYPKKEPSNQAIKQATKRKRNQVKKKYCLFNQL